MKTLCPRPGRIAAVLLAAVLAVFGVTSGGAQTSSLLTLNDLTWDGLYQFPASGDATPGGPGTTSYSSGALAVRYVSGQRRYLVPTFTVADPSTGQQWGDLVEYQDSVDALYAGSAVSAAPTLVETRRWANWTSLATYPNWQDANNGMRIGGLYWDEAHGVLWYQLYGYYSGHNKPFLAATKLLDTVTSGMYRAVGTKSGPWWYRNNDPNDLANLYWKAVDYWITPVPASARTDLGGRKFIVGAAVGAVGGAGNLGPGFHAISDLPPLSDSPNSVIPDGLHLADYSGASTQHPPQAHRDTNYTFRTGPSEGGGGLPLDSPDTGLYPPSGGRGFWQMSLDQVNSFCWVETGSKQGILLFGRAAHGDTWYGWNPRWQTPGNPHDPPDSNDPTRSSTPPDSNGYGASAWSGAVYEFDPMQVREVGRGIRSPYSDGINPALIGDWHAQWPNIPLNKDNLGGTGVSRPITSSISNTCYWDPAASQLIWVQPMSTDLGTARPTISFFTVRGPGSPSNLRIVSAP